MMDADGIAQLLKFDAIYLGAIGDPRVADHISARELILPLRQRLGQYVSTYDASARGITSPLANRHTADIDMVACARTPGRVLRIGGRLHAGTPDELAEQTGIFTRRGIERIVRYAFKIAERRPRRMLASATKSNALQHAMVLWDEVAADVAKDFPGVECGYHVDALCARMVTHPQTLDVIVASISSATSSRISDRRFREALVSHRAATSTLADNAVDVRADPRIGAGHRRQRDRQSDRGDLGRRDDARPPR